MWIQLEPFIDTENFSVYPTHSWLFSVMIK